MSKLNGLRNFFVDCTGTASNGAAYQTRQFQTLNSSAEVKFRQYDASLRLGAIYTFHGENTDSDTCKGTSSYLIYISGFDDFHDMRMG